MGVWSMKTTRRPCGPHGHRRYEKQIKSNGESYLDVFVVYTPHPMHPRPKPTHLFPAHSLHRSAVHTSIGPRAHVYRSTIDDNRLRVAQGFTGNLLWAARSAVYSRFAFCRWRGGWGVRAIHGEPGGAKINRRAWHFTGPNAVKSDEPRLLNW
jgi:hypothetical protein